MNYVKLFVKVGMWVVISIHFFWNQNHGNVEVTNVLFMRVIFLTLFVTSIFLKIILQPSNTNLSTL
jgi:hypothetical protein